MGQVEDVFAGSGRDRAAGGDDQTRVRVVRAGEPFRTVSRAWWVTSLATDARSPSAPAKVITSTSEEISAGSTGTQSSRYRPSPAAGSSSTSTGRVTRASIVATGLPWGSLTAMAKAPSVRVMRARIAPAPVRWTRTPFQEKGSHGGASAWAALSARMAASSSAGCRA
ncbi:hypothetical protein K7G98_00555 [Saccharothrix sp. MB29]|nr:hypothetical protein [Saccharothrix sp. MB29]